MTLSTLDILYEDNHCLAVAKPSGVVSTHFQGEEETVDRLLKAYLKEKYQKPGNVFLGVVHRLDRPVSGVLLFARTSKAAARLAEQFREGTVEKVYWAVVEGEVQSSAGTLEDWLRKNERTKRVEVVEPRYDRRSAGAAALSSAASHDGLTWLEVRPQTGRTHQLRVQLAHHGHPIYGDATYGSVHTFGRRHRPACARPDVPAPGPLRADHADRRAAARLARPLRLPVAGPSLTAMRLSVRCRGNATSRQRTLSRKR